MMGRAHVLAQLRTRRFDLAIVGGGIVGAGIARDAAMRGLSVALIEQGDFASGASSKTSKLIHGGLRYLEHGRFRLVAESVRERRVLRDIAPSLVRPLAILLPVYRGADRSPWHIRAGLWLYDALAAGRAIRRHRMVPARRALALEPGLRNDGLLAAGIYADCQMDDARLCLANIIQASTFGAVCANYVRLDELLMSAQGVAGCAASDALTGRPIEIRARAVINATGPWADRIRRLSHRDAPPRLAPTKGIHAILPRLAQEALFVPAHRDGRMFFILPYGEYSLVGTTEAPVTQPLERLTADAGEVGYLLEEVNRVLPGSHVAEDDVIATFAGARPLLGYAGGATHASREHRIEVDREGLISVMGGKYTTFRVMAQQAVDLVVARLRVKTDRCLTDQVMLMEGVQPITLEHWQALIAGIDPDLLARLMQRYGTGVVRILQLIARDRSLARPICPHHEVIEAELAFCLQHEFACTITDVLARRTAIAWSSCQGLDAMSTVVRLAARYGDVPSAVLEHQVDAYQQFLADSLAFRVGHAPAPLVS